MQISSGLFYLETITAWLLFYDQGECLNRYTFLLVTVTTVTSAEVFTQAIRSVRSFSVGPEFTDKTE